MMTLECAVVEELALPQYGGLPGGTLGVAAMSVGLIGFAAYGATKLRRILLIRARGTHRDNHAPSLCLLPTSHCTRTRTRTRRHQDPVIVHRFRWEDLFNNKKRKVTVAFSSPHPSFSKVDR